MRHNKMRARFKQFKYQIIVAAGVITICYATFGLFIDTRKMSSAKTTPDTFSQMHSLVAYKHVTKSLAELGKMDEINKYVLFLNAVPKSGSEILVLLLQRLQGWNNFRQVRLRGDEKDLNQADQEELVYTVYKTLHDEAVPVCFIKDVHFINFTKFDRQAPTYINFIRDPADHILSRFQHNARQKFPRKANINIENCMTDTTLLCDLYGNIKDDLAIPYFCGQEQRCSTVNDPWALQKAKSNVVKYYAVVGILEELNVTLEVVEEYVPYFFKGVQTLYFRDLIGQVHKKPPPKASDKLKQQLKVTLSNEYEFYEWIRSRLFRQLQMIYGEHRIH